MRGTCAALAAALLAGSAWAGPAQAPPAPVRDALAQLRAGQAALAAGWRYEERLTGTGGSERLLHDPSRPPGARWRVLQVNGRPPSAADQKRLAQQAERYGGAAGAKLHASADWLSVSTYRLVRSTAETLVYRVRPRPPAGGGDDEQELLRHLTGRLEIARGDHRPLSLTLGNFESFSPRFGVKVENFGFQAHFRRLGAAGPVVVVRATTQASGTIFWFKHFSNRTQVTLSGFAASPASTSAPASAPGT